MDKIRSSYLQSTELGKRPRVIADTAEQFNPESAPLDEKVRLSMDTTEEKRQCMEHNEVRLSSNEGSISSGLSLKTSLDTQTKNNVVRMLNILAEEFNCNHQADLTMGDKTSTQETIFSRSEEQKEIMQFLVSNVKKQSSGLMYLCGHPGTGKTSTLNIILSKMQDFKRRGQIDDFELFMFNAMTFTDVKSFALSLLQEVTEKKCEMQTSRIERNKIDTEELSKKVAKALSMGNDQKSKSLKKFRAVKPKHNIIVIDEVDQFNACEKGLTDLVRTIMKNEQFPYTCTSIVGIANTVDLPFKKKHSAIAMRDCQLLFEPYSIDQITDILEQKVNIKFHTLPSAIKANTELKQIFFDLVDDNAYLFIAKKVAKQNGDIRVAFDLMKSALEKLAKRTMECSDLPPKNKLRVTYQTILEVYEDKYGSKIAKTIHNLSRQHLVILFALAELFEEVGEEKLISYKRAFEAVERERKSRQQGKLQMPEFISCVDELEYYSFLKIERNKKDAKQNSLSLNIELDELIEQLNIIDKETKQKQE